MTFAISFMPADLEAPPPAYKAAIGAAVQANAGRIGPGGVVRLADGGEFVAQTGDVWPKTLTVQVCRVVFDVASRTNTYIETAGSDATPLKVKGSMVEAPTDLGPPMVVATPDVLCAELRNRLARWNRETGPLRDHGEIDANDEPLEPPPVPGAEQRLTNDPSGVAAHCESTLRKMAAPPGWKFVRSLVTRNPQWGVVWRADLAPDPDPLTWMREVCWREPSFQAMGRIRLSIRPPRMFDETKSIGPLPSE